MFLSDGTASLTVGTNTYTGTYTTTKSSVVLTLDAGSMTSLEIATSDFVLSNIPPGITVTVKSAKFSKITLKNGVPTKGTVTISGTGSETVGGKTKTKSFKVKTVWTDWTLSSGTNF